ncbi:MAG: SAM-dependent methyltransferase [Dactylosporangium sp.]|nr:SAM-dependent methyltransferase [Dactylosporangium sp.]NNJ62542.1 SAM-dependent methyltransferase [Dactylosporangium sp.]
MNGGHHADPGFEARRFDSTKAHPSRRYDYWLGGKDNFEADRTSGDDIAQAFPTIRIAAIENRRFLHRVVSFLAGQAGIRQFLDIGTGIPTSPNVHEIAQVIAPASRVAYVDNDPLVIAHARARLVGSPEGRTAYVRADLRDPATIGTHATLRDVFDWDQPIALLLIAVLHFLDDADDPHGAVSQLVSALPAGSYLALSHATFDLLPAATITGLTSLISPGAGHGAFRARNRRDVASFLDGLELISPGLAPIVDWQPEREPRPSATAAQTAVYGAVARLP